MNNTWRQFPSCQTPTWSLTWRLHRCGRLLQMFYSEWCWCRHMLKMNLLQSAINPFNLCHDAIMSFFTKWNCLGFTSFTWKSHTLCAVRRVLNLFKPGEEMGEVYRKQRKRKEEYTVNLINLNLRWNKELKLENQTSDDVLFLFLRFVW